MIDLNEIEKDVNQALKVTYFDVIDSTNAEAKRQAPSLYEARDNIPRLFIARSQTVGRGRMGRSFLSRADSGIFMSFLYFTEKPLYDAVTVTTAAAAIVAEAIESVADRPMRIKWVNDIYDDVGKVCGILAETLSLSPDLRAVIVGIGINTGELDFPEELQGIASSVGDISGREELLISRIADKLLLHAEAPENTEYMTEYRKRFMLTGERVCLMQNGEITDEGIVLGVDDRGGLLFLPDGKGETVAVHSGEISVRIKKE